MSDSSGSQTRLDAKEHCLSAKPDSNDASIAPLAELIALYQERVEQLAHRLMGWSGDSDDIVQEVFLAALRNISKFKGHSSYWTWLARITVNACRQHWRRQAVRKRLKWLFTRDSSQVQPAQDYFSQRESHERLVHVVQALPGRLREVVVLRYLQEMPLAEVAQALGISNNAVSIRLHRALLRLKETLGEDAL